jgi:hypothetical protein
MQVRLTGMLVVAVAVAVGVVVQGRGGLDPSTLVVHEWGTFTSKAGPDGQAVLWKPFARPSDLPGFVTVLNPASVKSGRNLTLPTLAATIRMETPVLYFYTDRAQTVDVDVRFPHGLISEWYPQAAVGGFARGAELSAMEGGIRWSKVQVEPGVEARVPVEEGYSHYYAARETDASPVRIGTQQEKFLFYRGLASLPVPLSARLTPEGRIALQRTGAGAAGRLVVFENDGRRAGFSLLPSGWPGDEAIVDRPVLNARPDAVHAELRRLLIEEGLFPREASAMVETWRDTWFEPGVRIFYLLPQAVVDELLPLRIEPAPRAIVRVFVGRLDLHTQ